MKEAPEIDLNGKVIETPDVDLWGNPIQAPMFPVKRAPSRIKRRASAFAGPSAETCGTCCHLRSHTTTPTRRFFKFGLAWNGAHSAASDIRKKHPACAKWEPKKKTP